MEYFMIQTGFYDTCVLLRAAAVVYWCRNRMWWWWCRVVQLETERLEAMKEEKQKFLDDLKEYVDGKNTKRTM